MAVCPPRSRASRQPKNPVLGNSCGGKMGLVSSDPVPRLGICVCVYVCGCVTVCMSIIRYYSHNGPDGKKL